MDAQEFFRDIVSPNYHEFFSYPNDVRRLWNAVISMNSVADYMAVGQIGYRPASRQELQDLADKLREDHGLEDLEVCADALKHLRKTGGSRSKFEVTATTTDVSSDTATWTINGLDVVDVLRRAFEKLKNIPEPK
jgi:hypothetical protein